MGKVKFLWNCIAHMNYGELFRTVWEVHNLTGKNRLGVLTDVVKCGLKYGAGFNDICSVSLQAYRRTESHLWSPAR